MALRLSDWTDTFTNNAMNKCGSHLNRRLDLALPKTLHGHEKLLYSYYCFFREQFAGF